MSGTNMQVESTSKPMFTVNEANEGTISENQEQRVRIKNNHQESSESSSESRTTIKNQVSHQVNQEQLVRIKNSVCLVIDVEGFFVQTKFQVREMGYYFLDYDVIIFDDVNPLGYCDVTVSLCPCWRTGLSLLLQIFF